MGSPAMEKDPSWAPYQETLHGGLDSWAVGKAPSGSPHQEWETGSAGMGIKLEDLHHRALGGGMGALAMPKALFRPRRSSGLN